MINRKEFSAGGICHMICEANLPELPESKAGMRMQQVLLKIRKTFFLCAEEALPAIAQQYEADRDPQKHLRHRPLSLSFEFCAEEKRSVYHITWKMCLSRCGRILSQKNGEARFDKQSGYLLSGREKKSIQKTKARRAIGF
jgi:hypothetical protein